MIDEIGQHLSTIRATAVAGLGTINLILGVWLIWIGLNDKPFFIWRGWSRVSDAHIPGRIVLGIYFLFYVFREWDVAVNRIKYGGGGKSADAVNDWNSVVPVVIGVAVFGIWSVIRFARGDIGDRSKTRGMIPQEENERG